MNTIETLLPLTRGYNFNHKDYQKMTFNDNPETRNVVDTMNFSIKWYPSLFNGVEAEEKALTHMFFCLGGGYEWYNGRLVMHYDSKDNEIFSNKKARYDSDFRKKEREELIRCTKDDIIFYSKNDFDFAKKRLIVLKADLPRHEAHHKVFDPFYTQNELDMNRIERLPNFITSGQITRIPDDVQDDYLLAGIRITEYYLYKIINNDIEYSCKDVDDMYNLHETLIDRFSSRLVDLGYSFLEKNNGNEEQTYGVKDYNSKIKYLDKIKEEYDKYISIKNDWDLSGSIINIGSIIYYNGKYDVISKNGNIIDYVDFIAAKENGWLIKTVI